MKNKIILLTDYRGFFYSSHCSNYTTMNLKTIVSEFSHYGFQAEILPIADLDLRKQNFSKIPVLYTSSEDTNLFYKDYLEDMLWGLQLQGAWLIPDLQFFRAHHNKVFMEILRDLSDLKEMQSIKSFGYGVFEDLTRSTPSFIPLVIKPSAGARSDGVVLAQNKNDILHYCKKISYSPNSYFSLAKTIIHRLKADHIDLLRRLKKVIENLETCRSAVFNSYYRKKFIVQNYIPGVHFDYKVLIYGDKFYVLLRKNRPNDFRASGSGLLSPPMQVPTELLEFSYKIFLSFDVPFISLDIGFDGEKFHLFEFQFLFFGNYTLESSNFYYQRSKNGWEKVLAKSCLEEKFVHSIILYLEKNNYQKNDTL